MHRAPDALTVVVTTATVAPTENVREILAADPELTGVKIERFSRVRTAVAFIAAPALPHRAHGRALVVAVDALARDGTLVSLRFYVDANALARAAHWASVARDAASTLQIAIDPSPPLPHVVERPHPPLPLGWDRRSDVYSTRIMSPHGECKVIDGELDARAVAPGNAGKVPGELWGNTVYWTTWVDHDGHHAELLTGAKSWGMVHAQCLAPTRAESYQQREVVKEQVE